MTDADILLGYIDPQHFAAGRLELDYTLAERAIESHISRATGMKPVDAAAAIYQIVNARMVDAMRLVTVQRGHDPREFAVMAFGGAGPVHAAAIDSELGTRKLIIPALATGLSAVGLVLSDLRHSFVRSMRMNLDQFDFASINEAIGDMEKQALRVLSREGVDPSSAIIEVSMDMCYKGQLHQLEIPVAHRRLDADALLEVGEDFGRLYKKHYGFSEDASHIQLVSLRLDGVGIVPRSEIEKHRVGAASSSAMKGRRQVFSPVDGAHADVPIYAGELAFPDMEFKGPALIEYPGTNVVIPAGYRAVCDPWLNLVVEG